LHEKAKALVLLSLVEKYVYDAMKRRGIDERVIRGVLLDSIEYIKVRLEECTIEELERELGI